MPDVPKAKKERAGSNPGPFCLPRPRVRRALFLSASCKLKQAAVLNQIFFDRRRLVSLGHFLFALHRRRDAAQRQPKQGESRAAVWDGCAPGAKIVEQHPITGPTRQRRAR